MVNLQQTVDKCMVATIGIFPSDRCILLCELLNSHGFSYSVKRGYLNTEVHSVPVCCTYLWIENEKGDIINRTHDVGCQVYRRQGTNCP